MTNNIVFIVSCLSLIVAIFSARYAWNSSKYTKENMQLTNALTLEIKLIEARQEWANAIKELSVLIATNDSSNKSLMLALELHSERVLINYLNIFERLCFFLLNETFKETSYKPHYQNLLNNTIKALHQNTATYPFSHQKVDVTQYTKMLELNDKWQNS